MTVSREGKSVSKSGIAMEKQSEGRGASAGCLVC